MRAPSALPCLPHELEQDPRLKNYQTVADPQLPESKGKEMCRRYETVPRRPTTDPRSREPKLRFTKRKVRKHLDEIVYAHDKHSVGPPPPQEIVVYGLSPRISPGTILQQCRAFGVVHVSELKVDPQTGESIGIMWVQFQHGSTPRGEQDASQVASRAKEALHGHKFGTETAQACLDREKTAYKRMYRDLLGKRYSGARRRVPPPPPPPKPVSMTRKWGKTPPPKDAANRATASRAIYQTARPMHLPQDGPKAVTLRTASVLQRLASLGRPYIFLPLSAQIVDADTIRRHFAHFSPALVDSDERGWYVGFSASDTAARCKRVLDTALLEGHNVCMDVCDAPRKDMEPSTAAPFAEAPVPIKKTEWTVDELVEEAIMQLLTELQAMFLRDVKNRTLTPLLTDFFRPQGAGGQRLAQHRPSTESTAHVARRIQGQLPSFRKRPEVVAVQKNAEKPPVKPKKNWRDALDYSGDESEESLGPSTHVPSTPPPPPDPIGLGITEDEEELYYLQLLLQREANGQLAMHGTALETMVHKSGSARSEGFYRIPAAEKAMHLPDRNRAVVDTSTTGSGLASARGNRADSRRLALDMEQHKRETMTDTDILKFNQLQTRKKQLCFAKSPIHDWGLYAMETIPAGDMVIEYVGEVVRQQVADLREKMYERAGNFSTYLFRVDDDVVVDATLKGNIARLMNHCCTPNCTAKILTLQGEKRIALFAKQTILPGQELTYDYKCTHAQD